MKTFTPVALACVALITGCATTGRMAPSRLATATITTSAGMPAGTAQISAAGDRLTIDVAVSGLQPGAHGLHLHAVGMCDAPGFTTAGPHLNPAGHMHGMMNPAGHHLGDLPNIVVGPDGTATLSAQIDGTREAMLASLFDADGTAIVIHAGQDDYKTDPSGNSGPRIACGVFSRP